MTPTTTRTTTRTTTGPTRLTTAARILLGIIFGLSGLNHIFALVPMPAMTGDTALFWQGLQQTGYFFPLLGVVELTAGLLLVRGGRVPLALTLVAPIALNVAVFHAVLAPQALGMVVVLLAALGLLAWHHRAVFAGVLAARAATTSAGLRAGELLLGVVFVASGVLGLLGRTPPPSTPGAAVMMEGLAAAGYFLPALSALQVLAGTLLVARRYVGVALMVLAPIVVEIAAYRLWTAGARPMMLLVAVALVAAEVWLVVRHWPTFAPLVRT
jgi:putative oxidoreductase